MIVPLGQQLVGLYLRYHDDGGRHSVVITVDGKLVQKERGPMLDFIIEAIAPLNKFLVEVLHRKPLSLASEAKQSSLFAATSKLDCFVASLLAMAIMRDLTEGVKHGYLLLQTRKRMTTVKRPKAVHQMTIAQFEATFVDEEACRSYLVARRWPNGVHCPRCGNAKVYALASGYHWQCEACQVNGYRFSHIAGTIFENTNKPLREWFRVVHLMLTSKKGISALQIQRMMGFGSYGTAHSMCHKIRAALIEPETKLGGIVEVDETFVGGKAKNWHWYKRDENPVRPLPAR